MLGGAGGKEGSHLLAFKTEVPELTTSKKMLTVRFGACVCPVSVDIKMRKMGLVFFSRFWYG